MLFRLTLARGGGASGMCFAPSEVNQLVVWQRRCGGPRIRRTLRLLVRRSNRRMRMRAIEHVATDDMEDQYEDGDDGERSETERRYVTRIHSWHSGAPGGWRRRACYFRGHFGCSFRFVGIPAHASRDESEPARQSNDGNGATPVSRCGAASGEALRACMQRNPCASCAAWARLRRSECASLMPRVLVGASRGQNVSKRDEGL